MSALQDAETRRILAVAARQHGIAVTGQLLATGWSKDVIAGRVRDGWLRRLYRGVFLVGPLETQQSRAIAAVLAAPGSVLSHYPAAVLRALRPPREGPMHVTLPHGSHRRPGLIVHRADLHPQDITRVHGIPVTSAARTLLDLAATEPTGELDRALNEARIARLVSDPSLNEQFSR
jgi:predicted transcriptional regulator of viral defense system